MADYYKSRHLAEPIIYVQQEQRFLTMTPGGEVTENRGEIPVATLNDLDPISEREAEELAAKRASRPELVERTLTRDVFAFAFPLELVARACLVALARLGWQTRVDTTGVLRARQAFKWWMLLGLLPLRMALTVKAADQKTLLVITHRNLVGTGRPGNLHRKIAAAIDMMDEMLRGTMQSDGQPSASAPEIQ